MDAGEKDWQPPVGDWLAQNGSPLIELPPPEPSQASQGDQNLAELSAARVQQMLERRNPRSFSRPSVGPRGVTPPSLPTAAAVSSTAPAAVLSRPARPLLPRSFPQHVVWPSRKAPATGGVGAAPSEAGKDLIASLQARLAHVEKLNQHQAAKITKLSQELSAAQAENALLRRALDVAEAEVAEVAEEAQEDVEQEVQMLRIERDEYKEQVQAMTKFLRDYGLTWVGDEPPGADDRGAEGAEGAEGGDVSVAAQLSRPNSALAEELVDLQVMSSRVAELNGLVEGARVQRSGGPGGAIYARFVAEEILPLTFFQDGVKLGPCAFQFYHSRAAQQLIQDIMDGYFPYELKQDYPDGVMLKVIDRVSQTFGAWKENASHDRDLAGIGDRLAVGKVLNGGDKVVRGGEICKVRDAARSGRARSCGPEKEVSLLVPTRPEKDPIAHVQVRIDQDHRAVFCLEVWQTVGDLEDAVEQWCSDEGLDGLRGGHLRTAFPPRSYVDREQSMSDAQLVPSATLFVATS